MSGLQEICHKVINYQVQYIYFNLQYGATLILDEVQTGGGGTGLIW